MRANALGILPDTAVDLYSAIYISAHFIKPCSEVKVNVPDQDWVVSTPKNNHLLPITISQYDKDSPDLEEIRVQFRRAGIDGVWTNVPKYSNFQNPDGSILRDSLGKDFTNIFWDTDGFADGEYEIRAVANCTGDLVGKPGISQIIKGRIERQPPSLIGTPQPSDGVYQVGDEISFSFNKDIDCTKLIAADITRPNNVGLYDALTGLLIDIDITCQGNTIYLDPNFQNEFFENRILRAELHNIKDLTGNNGVSPIFDAIGRTGWEFYVDRNELAWLTDRVSMTKTEGEVKSVTASIHNRGGYPVPFTITGAPDWVRVVPNTGTMNMVVALNIEGTLSTDEEDIVAAFINDELRGRASIRYYPTVDKYLAHLTIFGESVEVNAPIQLQVWDASACLRYGLGVDTFTFQPDNVLGTPVNPKVLFTDSHVLREIPLNNGWNWISFNLAFSDPAINPVLASLKHPANDVIKGQTPFAEYFGGSWFGSLNTLENTTMYQFRADQPDTIKMAGNVIDPTLLNIPLDGGWNWMGYLPNYPLAVNDALGSLNPASGDLIKGQYGFAQYIAPFGWIGNLNYLVPPQGYQIRLTNPGTLNYPPRNLIENGSVANRGEPSAAAAYWNVDPAKYENSMTLVGMLARDGQNTTLETHEIGVFAGEELRGSAQAIYVEPTDSYLFFLTAYSNGSGEQLRFNLYDAATGQVGQLVETTVFAPQMHQGSIQQPVVLHFELSPGPLIYSLAEIDYVESNCSPGFLVDVQASDDQDAEGSGLKYKIVGGPDSSRFQLDTLTGILAWKNFAPDFENPADADQNNTYLVEVRVSDLSGNASVQTITVFVKDDPIPSAKCPTAAIANTGDDGTGDCTTTVAAALSVTIPANCASYPIRYTLEGATTGQGDGQLPPGQLFASGSTTVRYTVTDESGTLSSACSFTVTVTDNEAPSLNCPTNISRVLFSGSATQTGTGATVSDNCSGFVLNYALSGATTKNRTGQVPGGQVFQAGTTTVLYTATDGDGIGQSTCSFTVTLTETLKPNVTCPANTTIRSPSP